MSRPGALAALALCAAVWIPAVPAVVEGAPVDIRSDSLRIREETGEVVFEGRVRVQMDGAVMTCDALTVTADTGGGIRSGLAVGNVVVSRGGDRVLAGRALFDPGEGMVQLTENPVLTRDGSRIEGARITYDLGEGTALFEGPVKALFESGEGGD